MQVRKPDQTAPPSTGLQNASGATSGGTGAPPASRVQVRLHDAVGFLTALEADGSYVGGYLILNPAARPLEFHCTAPVWPTRAQEILYGPTLLPFLIGEQIGGALLKKAKLNPRLLVTDTEPMLAARMTHPLPLVHLSDGDAPAAARGFEDDLPKMTETLERLGQALDLREPFTRIQDAIKEAQKSRKAS